MKLPSTLRPSNSYYRKLNIGIDLPRWFIDELKSIDTKLYVVWHPYRVLYDDIINQYEGPRLDPRYTIHQKYGQENWGFVPTDRHGAPVPDNTWHVWRLCEPHGWGHVVKIESTDPGYLRLINRRLHLQAKFRDQYGDIAWNRHVRADQETQQEKKMAAQKDLFEAVQEENSWLTRRAMENMQRGITAPTNPQKETISSFAGQTNRSRLIRPLEDEDVGLVGFDK